MLKSQTDIKNDVIVKLGISTTAQFYTDAILDDWVQEAHRWATSYKKYPFTEGRVETTYATGSGSGGDEFFFEGYKSDTFRIMKIDKYLLEKLNFEDYLMMRERTPDSTDRVYTDFGKLVYINPKIDKSGTLTAYGQYTPTDPDMTGAEADTIFADGNEEGNTAIVEEVLSYAKLRERNVNESQAHHERAMSLLDGLVQNIENEQFDYKTHDTRGGMWERIDVVNGTIPKDFNNTNQF